jgi:hypothetical protein
MANEEKKVFELTKELCSNNLFISNQTAKLKGIKDVIKSYSERNAAIMDELKVHTQDELEQDGDVTDY